MLTLADIPFALAPILSHLKDWNDILAASEVNKEWHKAANSPGLWSSLDLSGKQDGIPLLLKAPKSPQLCRHLRAVNLEFTAGIEDSHLELLASFHLTILNLNGCQRLSEAAIVRLLPRLPHLERLELYWVLSVADDALLAIAAYCSGLTYLSLSGCKRVGDQGLRVLVGSCSGLTHLNLTRCMQVTPKGIISAAENCRKLRELYLYACSQVTDACLVAVGKLRDLRLISLCGGTLLTDDGLAGLAKCRQLRSVDLSWCIALTDRGVCKLASGCHLLEMLSLHGIRGVTDASIASLARSCGATLATLDVNGCVGIQARSREQLKARLPKLTCFVVHT